MSAKLFLILAVVFGLWLVASGRGEMVPHPSPRAGPTEASTWTVWSRQPGNRWIAIPAPSYEVACRIRKAFLHKGWEVRIENGPGFSPLSAATRSADVHA